TANASPLRVAGINRVLRKFVEACRSAALGDSAGWGRGWGQNDLSQPISNSKGGAGDGLRTRYLDLGKVALYQVSYSRSARGSILPGPAGPRSRRPRETGTAGTAGPTDLAARSHALRTHAAWSGPGARTARQPESPRSPR